MKNRIYGVFIAYLLVACTGGAGGEHTHEGEAHGHEPGDELTIDTTVWTDQLEMFVEYPAFVTGHTSRFAAHFTRLDGHKPLAEGRVTVSLVRGDKGIRHTVEEPSSPGIFSPALQPSKAGEYRLFFDVKAPGLEERIELGTVTVYPDDEAAQEALAGHEQTEPEISFLKEQAWKIDFQTAKATMDTVYGLVRTTGKWMSAPGTQRSLTAPRAGNVLFEMPGLIEGVAVSRGQSLMSISGQELNVGSLEADVRKAKAALDQARSEYERKKELNEMQVVPDSEFEEVKKRYEVAQANYQELVKNYSAGGISIRAPFDGYIKQVNIDNGAFAAAGTPLITIGSERNRLIKTYAAPDQRQRLITTEKVWVMENGNVRPVSGRVLSVGRNVTEEQPMLPVFLEVQSPGQAVEGSLVEVQLGYTTGQQGIVIPKSALLEDFGTYKVIVQTGGEGFEMRPVHIGTFNGDRVSVKEGLQEGEWIVTNGAYQVKMASMTGDAPAHGHTH